MATTIAEPIAANSDDLLGQPTGEMVLRIRGTPRHGQIIRLKSKKCTVGAGPSCTLRLRMPGIRDLHCLILRGATGTVVRRWSHDTLLNGAIFNDAPLTVGDRLGIGPIELEVLSDESQAPIARQLESRREAFPTLPLSLKTDSPLPLPAASSPSIQQFKSALELGRQRTRRLVDKLRDAQDRLAELQAAATQRQEAVAALSVRLQKLEASARHAAASQLAAESGQPPVVRVESIAQVINPSELVAPFTAPLADLTNAVQQLQGEVLEQRRLREQHDQALRAEWETVRQTWQTLETRLATNPAPVATDPVNGEVTALTNETFDETLRDRARELDERTREFESRSQSLDEMSQRLEHRAVQIEKWSAQIEEESRAIASQREQLSEDAQRQEADHRRLEDELAQRKVDLEREEARLANQREEIAARQKLREASYEGTSRVEEPVVEPTAEETHPPEAAAEANETKEEKGFIPPAVADVLARLGRHVFSPSDDAKESTPAEEIRRPDPISALDEIDRLRMAAWHNDEPTEPQQQIEETPPSLASHDSDSSTESYDREETGREPTREESATSDRETPAEEAYASTEEQTPVAPQPKQEAATPAEDDDSIEAYMARLLQRVQGGASDPAPARRAPEPVRHQVAPVVASEPEPAATPLVPESPLDPAEYIPRAQAPERNSSLSAMREVANASARSAIENSDKRRGGDTAVWKLGLAGCGLMVATILPIGLGFDNVIALVGMSIGLVVAGVFGVRGALAYLKNQIAPATGSSGSGQMSDDGEDEGDQD